MAAKLPRHRTGSLSKCATTQLERRVVESSRIVIVVISQMALIAAARCLVILLAAAIPEHGEPRLHATFAFVRSKVLCVLGTEPPSRVIATSSIVILAAHKRLATDLARAAAGHPSHVSRGYREDREGQRGAVHACLEPGLPTPRSISRRIPDCSTGTGTGPGTSTSTSRCQGGGYCTGTVFHLLRFVCFTSGPLRPIRRLAWRRGGGCLSERDACGGGGSR